MPSHPFTAERALGRQWSGLRGAARNLAFEFLNRSRSSVVNALADPGLDLNLPTHGRNVSAVITTFSGFCARRTAALRAMCRSGTCLRLRSNYRIQEWYSWV
ncbi:MAG: hypothetical protein M3O70_01720 [Actinomycetota bacterium]|nr:hypothetical protein [Actinomycetota bacterium]